MDHINPIFNDVYIIIFKLVAVLFYLSLYILNLRINKKGGLT